MLLLTVYRNKRIINILIYISFHKILVIWVLILSCFASLLEEIELLVTDLCTPDGVFQLTDWWPVAKSYINLLLEDIDACSLFRVDFFTCIWNLYTLGILIINITKDPAHLSKKKKKSVFMNKMSWTKTLHWIWTHS